MIPDIIRKTTRSVAQGDPYYSTLSLLLPMDGSNGSTTFTDRSSNNLTVTANGNAQISTAQSKFGGASGSFDGTNSYLSAAWSPPLALTGDFTVEMWIYPTATPNGSALIGEQYTGGTNPVNWCFAFVDSATSVTTGSKLYFGSYSGSAWSGVLTAVTPTLNQWSHVAAVRSGSTLTIYLNGTSVGSGSFSAAILTGDNLYIGRRWDAYVSNPYFQGYIDDLAVYKGYAKYTTAFTPPTSPHATFEATVPADAYYSSDSILLHMDGTNGSTSFVDSGPNALAVTASGAAAISTAQSKFGGASGYFQRSSASYISMASGTVLNFGSGDFTVEGWINLGDTTANTTKGIVSGTASGSFGFRVGQSYAGSINGLSVYKAAVADCEYCSYTFSANTWYHVAVVRKSGVITFFVNGSPQTTLGSGVASYSCPSTTNTKVAATDSSAENFNGYIDDLRVTKYARYQSTFTPPTKAFPNLYNPYTTLPVSGAALWLDASQQNTLFTDAGVNAVKASGDLVYQWNDLSGNNRHATQATSGNRPTWNPPASGQNGLGVVGFNGTSGFMTIPSLPISGAFTFVFVLKTSGSGLVYEHSANANTNNGSYLYVATGNSSKTRRNSLNSSKNATTNWLADGVCNFVVQRAGGTQATHKLNKNGTWLTLTDVSTEINDVGTSTATDTLYIASRSGATIFNSQILCECILFNSTLSDSDVSTLYSYLKAKWGTP